MKLGIVWQLLGNSGVYYPRLAKVTGGVTASILFCYLVQRQSELSNPNEWVKITADEIGYATGLSRTEQKLARSQLVKRSLIKEKLLSGDGELLQCWADVATLERRLNDIGEKPRSSPFTNTIDTRVETVAQEPTSDQQPLPNNPRNSHSNITIETSEEEIISVRRERENSVSVESYIVARNSLAQTEKTQSLGDVSSAETAVNGVENSCTATPLIKTDKFFPVRRQPIAVKVTPHYQFSGPWESAEQFEAFQRALLEYFKQQGIESPSGWVFRIVDGMTKGLVSPFWDEFISGIPLGESQKVKRDWEIQLGVPYPAFEEERIQYYLHKGESIEEAVSKARSDLRNPVLGKDLWEGFLRKCDRVADEAIKAKKLGVQTPYLPPSFTEKPQITKQSVMTKLAMVNPQFSLESSNLKSLGEQNLEQQEVKDKAVESIGNIPSLSTLQEMYQTPIGRTLVEKQIAQHPEWGYEIVEGQVVDLMPF